MHLHIRIHRHRHRHTLTAYTGCIYYPHAQVDAVVKALENPVVLGCHKTLEIALAAMRNLTSHNDTADEIICLGVHKVLASSEPEPVTSISTASPLTITITTSANTNANTSSAPPTPALGLTLAPASPTPAPTPTSAPPPSAPGRTPRLCYSI